MARQAAARQWQREDGIRTEHQREQQLQELMSAWTELHRIKNRGGWEPSVLMDEQPTPGESRRQLELCFEFWRPCKLAALLSRNAGYPAAAKFLYEMHHFEEDIANTDARYEAVMKVAEQYLENPDKIEQKLAPNPSRSAAQWVALASWHRKEPDAGDAV
ncbi:hypothetical protein [uncultured Serinicoccus sp.]|uniref:hypothetical protein n=1 Tax=uncultured Serinicoccus sp. TaxID=735514 RepID=UPI002607BFC8|nr:hypothetical protein [uncultured Serinicoccus sp.]